MSAETLEWLNANTLIGFTEKRGNAWHYRAQLQGTRPNHYPGAIPVKDVLERLMYWEALGFPLSVVIPAGGPGNENGTEDIVVTDASHQVIIRSDTHAVLGKFKDGYQPHQFSEVLIENISRILDDDLAIASAGLLKGGALGWVQVETPETIVNKYGIEHRPFLMAFTSHDGTSTTGYQRGTNSVVCDNTFNIFRRTGGRTYRIKHTKYSNLRLESARDALDIVYSTGDDFNAEFAALCEQEVNNKQWAAFLDLAAPMPEDVDKNKNAATRAETKRDVLSNLYRLDNRCAPWVGTAFGVVQTVNTYNQHLSQIRGIGDVDDATRGVKLGERAIMRSIDGTLDKATTETLTALEQVLASV